MQCTNYQNFIKTVANSINKNGSANIIQNYVSAATWYKIQIGAMAIAGVFVLVLLWLIKNFESTTNWFYTIFRTIFFDAKKLLQVAEPDKIVFICCLIFLSLHSLYYINTWSIQYDECWTYNYFLNKSILFSFLTPNNNHNLFTLICWFAIKLPLAKVISYRLVALLLGLLSLVAYRKLSSMLFSQTTHTVSLCIYTASLPLMYYSVIARSYSGTILCVCLSLICIFKIAERTNSQKFYFYFAFIQTIGLFFNPIYLYAAITNYIILLFVSKYNLGKILKSSIVFFAFTILFTGIPLIILNGYKPLMAVVTQQTNAPINLALGGAHMLVHFFTGAHNAGIVFWIALLVFVTVGFIYKKHILFIVAFALAVPILACVLQKQILYERVFTYLVPFVALGITSVFAIFIKGKIYNYLFSLLFLVSGTYFYTQHTLFFWNIGKDHAVQKTAELLLNKNVDSIYNFVNYAKPGLEFYYAQANKYLHIAMPNTNSIDFRGFDSTQIYESIICEESNKFKAEKYTSEKILNDWQVYFRK